MFQKSNQELFGDIPSIYIYFDCIIIEFLNRTVKYNVKFYVDKIQFKIDKIKYCGHIIRKNKVEIDSKYTKAITELEQPKTRKQSYLSF